MSKAFCEIDEKIIKKIEQVTLTDTEAKGNMVPIENIQSIFEDLLYEIDRLYEQIEDLNAPKEENTDFYEDLVLGLR